MKSRILFALLFAAVGCGTTEDLETKKGAYTRSSDGILRTDVSGEEWPISGSFTDCNGAPIYVSNSFMKQSLFSTYPLIYLDRIEVDVTYADVNNYQQQLALQCYRLVGNPPTSTASAQMAVTYAYGPPVLYNVSTVDCDVWRLPAGTSTWLSVGHSTADQASFQYVPPAPGDYDRWALNMLMKSNAQWCPNATLSGSLHTTTIPPR